MILAQVNPDKARNAAERAAAWLREQNPPSWQDTLNQLAALTPWQAVALVVVGIVFLTLGYRIFKMLVIVNAAAAGGYLGWRLGTMNALPDMPLVFALVGAALLGFLAWPLMKLLVGIMGAMAGAAVGGFVGYAIAGASGAAPELYALVGGGVGLVVMSLLAVMLFKPGVMLATAIQGGAMVGAGGAALLLQPRFGSTYRDFLLQHEQLLGIICLAIGLAGFLTQRALDHAAAAPAAAPKKPAES